MNILISIFMVSHVNVDVEDIFIYMKMSDVDGMHKVNNGTFREIRIVNLIFVGSIGLLRIENK